MSKLPSILLREVTEADLPIHFQIQREPAGFQMAHVRSRDEVEFFKHWRETILPDPETVIKTIEFEGAVVGDVTSFILEGRRVVGYWIAQKYWGRGIATAALKEFLRTCEKRRPLSAYVAVKNAASFRVLEKCGFRRVGEAITASDGVKEFRMEL